MAKVAVFGAIMAVLVATMIATGLGAKLLQLVWRGGSRTRRKPPKVHRCCIGHNWLCEPMNMCCTRCSEAHHPQHPLGARCVREIYEERS